MAVTTALIVTSVVASAYAAKKQAEAAEAATKAQTESGHEALDFQKDELEYQKQLDREQQQYDRTRAAPYIGAGTAALGTLSSLMGLPPPPTTVPGAKLPGADNKGPGVGDPLGNVPVPTPQQVTTNLLTTTNTALSLADQRRAELGLPPLGTAAGSAPVTTPGTSGGGASSYVMMKAPNGQTSQVDLKDVPHVEARGARRVS